MPLSVTAPLSSSGSDAEVTRGPEAVGTVADNWLDSGVDAAGPRRGLPLNNMPVQSLSIYGGRRSQEQTSRLAEIWPCLEAQGFLPPAQAITNRAAFCFSLPPPFSSSFENTTF